MGKKLKVGKWKMEGFDIREKNDYFKYQMTITITDFKTHCLRILREIEQSNKPVEISKQGKVRFRIIPVEAPEKVPWMRLHSQGTLRGAPGESVLHEEDWEASR